MGLLDLQAKWIEKFDEMRRADDQERLAAPFLSVPGELGGLKGNGSIMLVGKATAGNWRSESFNATVRRPTERLEERWKATYDHLRAEREKQRSAFWRFWGRLDTIGSPVIWTNLAKIGVKSGNPHGWYLESQKELACQTLEAEIKEYKPFLVVLVTADYAKREIVYCQWPQRNWNVSKIDGTCWIASNGREPPVLWTDHPQAKPKERIEYWLRKARELTKS